jgi:hypothetical protein
MYLSSPLLGVSPRGLISCLGGFLIALSAPVACWSLGGLETCGYSAAILCAAFLTCDERARPWRLRTGGIAAGLCALLRPEGFLIIISLIIALIILTDLKPPIKTINFAVPAITIFVLHILWRRFYYSDWLPNTFYAKVGSNISQIERGLRYVQIFFTEQGGFIIWALPFVVVWLLPVRPFARVRALIGIVITLAVIAVGGDGLPMYRFMVPIIPIWALLVQTIISEILSAGHRLFPAKATSLSVGVFCLVIFIGVTFIAISGQSEQFMLYEYQKTYEVPRWSAAGRWLAQNASPEASIACVPIGAVGYYSNLRVFDMMGLTDKHIAHKPVEIGKGWAGHEKHDGPYILSKKPTYLLLGNIQVLDQPLTSDSPYFVRPPVDAIRIREDDIFTPELNNQYEPRMVVLPLNLYFHFLQARQPKKESAIPVSQPNQAK